MFTICIIGGGAAGISALAQLVEKFRNDHSITEQICIIVIEKSKDVGPGLAYGTPDHSHIINLNANVMSPIMDVPTHFVNWLKNNKSKWSQFYPELDIDKCAYPPRSLFGMYLKDLALKTQEIAHQSSAPLIKIEFMYAEAIDMQRDQDKTFLVHLKDSAHRIAAQQVILCIGHLPSSEYLHLNKPENKGYFHNPWQLDQYASIEPYEDICVIGTGLTAIDITLSFLARGHKGKIYMISRRGLLPAVIGPTEDNSPRRHLTINLNLDEVESLTAGYTQPLKLTDVITRFRKDLEHAESTTISDEQFEKILNPKSNPIKWLENQLSYVKSGNIRPWQSLLTAQYSIVTKIWSALSNTDKKMFLENFYRIWMTYLAAFPPENAEKLLKHLHTKQVHVLGNLREINFDPTSKHYVVSFNQSTNMKFKYVINATGAGHNIATSAFLTNLVKRNLISPHPLGGINVQYKKLHAITADGKKITNLAVIGDATWGVCMATADLGQIGKEAQRLVNILYEEFKKTQSEKQVLRNSSDRSNKISSQQFFAYFLKSMGDCLTPPDEETKIKGTPNMLHESFFAMMRGMQQGHPDFIPSDTDKKVNNPNFIPSDTEKNINNPSLITK